jgi:hypothetical protein
MDIIEKLVILICVLLLLSSLLGKDKKEAFSHNLFIVFVIVMLYFLFLLIMWNLE